jgi:hypothetical protein
MWTVFHRERKEAEAEDDEDEREEVFSWDEVVEVMESECDLRRLELGGLLEIRLLLPAATRAGFGWTWSFSSSTLRGSIGDGGGGARNVGLDRALVSNCRFVGSMDLLSSSCCYSSLSKDVGSACCLRMMTTMLWWGGHEKMTDQAVFFLPRDETTGKSTW